MTAAEKVDFQGAFGSRLAARIHRPASEPAAWALFAHCFTCSKDLKAAVRLSRALAERGIGTVRFDFTGLGESEGDFADTNFSSNVDDLVAAADYMREELQAPRILVGHSLGGAAVLSAAHRIAEVVAVATIGAPYDPAHVRRLIENQAPDIAEAGVCLVSLAGREFTIKKQLIEDLESQQSSEAIARLGRALLVFHSPQDRIVGVDNARQIYEAARHPKSFVSLDGADHLLRRSEDAEYVGEVLAAWASRYLPEGRETHPAGEEAQEDGVAFVRGGSSGFAQRISVSGHALRADEPEDVPGGTDTGPSPYDLLLAGLGACKSMTVRMYADRKKWPLEGVRVRLQHEKVHADDCDDCDQKKRMIDHIGVRLTVEGDLDEEQRKRLLEISERCPVHRTLTSEVRIESELEEG